MKINRAYRYELDPNCEQQILLAKHAGVARFAYNWGLARRIELYQQTGKSTNAIEQHRELNRLKKTQFPWMYEVSKCAPQEALRDLDRAFRNFFRGRQEKGAGRQLPPNRSDPRLGSGGAITTSWYDSSEGSAACSRAHPVGDGKP